MCRPPPSSRPSPLSGNRDPLLERWIKKSRRWEWRREQRHGATASARMPPAAWSRRSDAKLMCSRADGGQLTGAPPSPLSAVENGRPSRGLGSRTSSAQMMDGAAPQAAQGILGKGIGIKQQMWLKSFGRRLRVLINVAVTTRHFDRRR